MRNRTLELVSKPVLYRTGQAALEYALALALIAVPLAASIILVMMGEKQDHSNSILKGTVTQSFGNQTDAKKLGYIARPNP